MYSHHYQHNEQQRHQYLAQSLDTLVHLKPQHSCCQHYRHYGIAYHRGSIMLKSLEKVGQSLGIHSCKGVHRCLHHVVEAPSRNHEIETREQSDRHKRNPRQPLPVAIAAQRPVCAIGALARQFAYHKFIYHQGQSEYQRAHHIEYDERTTAVLAYHVRKLPYTTQTNGTAGSSQQHTNF